MLCSARVLLARGARRAGAGAGAARTMADKFKLPARFGAGEKSVWVEYIQLAADYKPAVNLGQGFPDYPVPQHVTDTLAEVTTGADPLLNQYTRGFGHVRLVKALSRLYSGLVERDIDPFKEVLVTAGAYEALYAAIMGNVEKGDEVIVIEPFFDCYEPMIKMAGGTPKFIPLRPTTPCGGMMSSDQWRLDEKELRSLFNEKTKMIILNTPHNPLGKVFTLKELETIAGLCKEFNVLCVSDEVYEWMVYEPKKHIRIASLPGMWDLTITIGSAGKTFSVTGWKTGWAYGPANLMNNLFVVHQNCLYTCNTTMQEAIARSFEHEMDRWGMEDCYLFSLAKELLPKRDYLIEILIKAGFKPTVPDGGYFIIADWSGLADKLDMSGETDRMKDYRFTKAFTKKVGVMTIPPSAFYSKDHKRMGEDFVRFCFIKKDQNLVLVDQLFQKWRASC